MFSAPTFNLPPPPPGYTRIKPPPPAEARDCIPTPEEPEKKKLRSFVDYLYDIIDEKNNKVCELRTIAKRIDRYLEEEKSE
jgi:hypothetical protein